MPDAKSKPGFFHRHGAILVIMLFCFLLHRFFFPFLINRYSLFYISAYWHVDVDGWSAVGEHLLEGKGYRNTRGKITAERGPVFPLYLALIYRIFGVEKGKKIAVTMQMVIEAINCWLIYLLAYKLCRSRSVGLLAASLWALYPLGMIIDIYLYSEPLFTLILLVFNLYLADTLKDLRLPQFFLAGTWLGLATLCRPITQYFPLVLLSALIYLFRRRFKEILSGSLAFLVGFCLVLSPWVIKNYMDFKKFVPGSTLLGYNWYCSLIRMQKPNYFELEEFYNPQEIDTLVEQDLAAQGISIAGKNEAEIDEIFRQQAWQTIKKYPQRYLKVCLNRLGIILLNIDSQGYPRLRSLAITLIQLALFGLSLIAFIFYPDKWAYSCIPLLFLIAYNTLAYSLLLGSWRFSVPMMPYIMIWASLGLIGLSQSVHKS